MSTTTQTVELSDVPGEIGGLLERVNRGETRVLVEKGGVPFAMIVSPEDWQRREEWADEEEDPFAILDEMAAAFRGVPAEEIERETEKAVAEVRAEMRAERAARAAAARG
jgi:prevent-host-death family protein